MHRDRQPPFQIQIDIQQCSGSHNGSDLCKWIPHITSEQKETLALSPSFSLSVLFKLSYYLLVNLSLSFSISYLFLFSLSFFLSFFPSLSLSLSLFHSLPPSLYLSPSLPLSLPPS